MARILTISILSCLAWAGPSTVRAELITVRSDQTWRTTTPEPGVGWNTDVLFDDSDAAGWENAFKSPTGDNIWHTSNLSSQAPDQAWFRHVFMLDAPVLSAEATFFFDDDGEAYINGQLVVSDPGGGATTFNLTLDPALFQVGPNLVAVHGIDRFGPFNNVAVSLRLDVVPEPSTLTLLGVGTLGLLGYGWRRRNQVR